MKPPQLTTIPNISASAGGPFKRPLRVLLAGDSASGKTTLTSVLSTGTCDNGCGSARKDLLHHPHERESGHTSQIKSYILRYGENREPIHGTTPAGNPEKIVHVFDGCGAQEFLKAMVHGFTSTAPDYVFLLVSAETGVSAITREHMGIALALRVPIVVVVTRTDLCKPEDLGATLNEISDLIKKGTSKDMIFLCDLALEVVCSKVAHGVAIPIMTVSAVSGEGIPKLHEFLASLEIPNSVASSDPKAMTEVWIRKTYNIPTIGLVIEGLLRAGKIRRGQFLRLGPIEDSFRLVTVKSVVTCQGEVQQADAGEDVAVQVISADGCKLPIDELKKLKGLVMLGKLPKEGPAKAFDAEIVVVSKAFIKKGRTVTVHTGNIAQSAVVDDLAGEELLKQGDKGLIKCRFEAGHYVKAGEKVIFRSAMTIAIGVITKIYT